jgi:hypothetical protein
MVSAARRRCRPSARQAVDKVNETTSLKATVPTAKVLKSGHSAQVLRGG